MTSCSCSPTCSRLQPSRARSRSCTSPRPSVVRTLELANIHGADHSDHELVGALVALAHAAAGSNADLLSYRGYNTADEPENIGPAVYDRVSLGMRAYEACATGCAACG